MHPEPAITDMVIYRNYTGEDLPAVVLSSDGMSVDLHVFTGHGGSIGVFGCEHDAQAAENTWRWPEQEHAPETA